MPNSNRNNYIKINGVKHTVSREVYKTHRHFDNQLKYSEFNRKIEKVTVDESGRVTVEPSTEDSLERLCEIDKQFPDERGLSVEAYIELKTMLEDAIGQLNKDEQKFIEMHYFQGYSITAMSEMLEFSVVKTYRKRNEILAKLHKLLSE